MGALSERHEVRVRSKQHTFVFVADTDEGRLIIRQEPLEGASDEEVCALTLADPQELKDFFHGLRRVLAASGQETGRRAAPTDRSPRQLSLRNVPSPEEREQLVEAARTRNPHAFEPWTREEERQVVDRYEAGASIDEIAAAHARSRRAIELRLRRLGVMATGLRG